MSDDIEKPNNDNVLDKVNTDDPEDDTSEKAAKTAKTAKTVKTVKTPKVRVAKGRKRIQSDEERRQRILESKRAHDRRRYEQDKILRAKDPSELTERERNRLEMLRRNQRLHAQKRRAN